MCLCPPVLAGAWAWLHGLLLGNGGKQQRRDMQHRKRAREADTDWRVGFCFREAIC
jgi:hypothetical protein